MSASRADRQDVVPPTLDEPIVAAAFFLSGAAGLVFEIVWIHRCGLVFGNSVWSTSAVLSSLMAGLALGNGLAGAFAGRVRALRAYAALELTVAASGVALTYLLPHLSAFLVPLVRPLEGSPWLVTALRFSAAFTVIVLPATAMGATFPIVVGGMAQGRSFGRVLGRFYGWNTIGAVAGALAAEIVLIPRLGIPGSAWMAGSADVAAAVLALWVSRAAVRTALPARASRSSVAPPSVLWTLLGCAFLAGAALLALEVVWFRFLSMFVVNTSLTVSLMLAVVLASIGLGGMAGGLWRNGRATGGVSLVSAAAAFSVTASYLVFRFATSGSLVAEPARILWFSLVLTSATSFLSGVLFTLMGAAIAPAAGEQARAAGWLTLANTVGGMCGPLAATFLLLPLLGMERALLVLSVVYCVIAGLSLLATGFAGWRRAIAPAAIAAVALIAFPSGLMTRVYFPRSAAPYTVDGSLVVSTREGPTETILLTQQNWLNQPIYQRLVTNGFSMSGTHLTGKRYMRAFAYWPMLLHKEPLRRALVVCYGVGVTAAAVEDIRSIESIDVAEISKDIVATSDVIYASGGHPLHDPRVRLHLEDGRQFLQTTTDRFDLITGEPPPPLTPGTVNLYTREYFSLVRDRLADGGMATYWLPIARRGEYSLAPIIRAFCDAFPDCSLWNGTLFDWMLVGTRGASGRVDDAAFAAPWADAVVGPHLREVGFEAPEQIGAAFLGDASYLDQLTRGTPPLTDDYPRRLVRPWPSFDRVFSEVLDTTRARRAFEASPFIKQLWPEELAKRTGPFFVAQGVINEVMLEGANPLARIAELHALLASTTLRRLPLWALGSSDALQTAADAVKDRNGEVFYLLAERLLVARSYGAAANYFAQAERRGFVSPAARPLEVYALCMAGQLDAARRLSPTTAPSGADETTFWRWMATQFAVGPYA